MSLNVNNMAQPKGNNLGYPTVGPRVSRLVGVVDMGIQDRPAYAGQQKDPCRKINITFELTDDFVEIGGVQKPRWISKSVNAFSSDKSSLTAIIKALDPSNQYQGDLAAMCRAGAPCVVQIEQKTDGNKNPIEGTRIGAIGALPPGFPVPDLQNVPVVFDMETPDINVFLGLQEWLQKQIKAAKDYPGSQLEALVNAHAASNSQTQTGGQNVQNQPVPVQTVAATPTAPAPAPVAAPVASPAPVATQAGNVPAAPPGFVYDAATNSYKPVAQGEGEGANAAPPAGAPY